MNEVIEKINAAHSIAVLGHVNEDTDSLGSCFAFAHVMRNLGKKAVVYMSAAIEKRLEFLCSDYVVFDENTVYDHDLCVCIDCGDIQRLGERAEIFNSALSTVNIDHHRTNTLFAQANCVDGEASSAGEMLCRIFREMGVKLDKNSAKYLYAAIASDTGCFKFSCVTPATMRETADLFEYDFDHAEVARLLFDTHTMESTVFRSYIMRDIKSYNDGKIRVVRVPEGLCEKLGIDEEDVPNVVDIPRCIEGTEIAVALKLRGDEVRVNLRSNGNADISQIAVKFGGGGHAKAAGLGIKNVTMDEAEKIIVSACNEVL